LAPDSKTWRLLGSRTPDEPLPIIPPGTGFFLTKHNTPTSLLQTGDIRVTDFAVSRPKGVHIPGSPFATSPSDQPENKSLHQNKKNVAQPPQSGLISKISDSESVLINPISK